MARKRVYETRIKARFSEIEEWISNGATEKEVMKRLGVSHSTWARYKNTKSELRELLEKSRLVAVDNIENAMYTAALGEMRTITKYMKCKHVDYENGKRVSEREVMIPYEEEIYLPPNMTAAIYLLKHWGKSRGYTNDPLSLDIKKEELALKKEIAEKNNW